MSRYRRSLVSKLKSGILPIRLETGRYKGLKEELHICEQCGKDVETEIHMLFKCDKLKDTRKPFLKKIESKFPETKAMSDCARLKFFLQSNQIKDFARWLEDMFEHRKRLLYKTV